MTGPWYARLCRPLGSVRVRLFLSCWILLSLHFATNIVREHYPAFALVAHGNYRLDEYVGFHSDIFVHRGDGHAYINNNIGTSVIAAGPLLIFRPLLDVLEARAKRVLAEHPGTVDTSFDTKYPNREKFFRLVRERGLELRFGAAAAITSVLLMAPLSALLALFLFDHVRRRGVAEGRALTLAFLAAFATPVFFRTAHLNHNMMVMYATFGAFLALQRALAEPATVLTTRRAALAGLLSGVAVMCDYSGTITAAVFGIGVLWLTRRQGRAALIRNALAFGVAALLPIGVQLHSQWVCFGSWIHPPQTWMADANFTDLGYRGFAPPAPDLFFDNLFEHRWGLFAYGPLLILGLLPPRSRPGQTPLVSRREWWFGMIYLALFMLFCASNQYARMQWNTGVRYLMPVVPILFLFACQHLARLRGAFLFLLAAPAVLHEWVLCLRRDNDLWAEWKSFLADGPRLPWLDVLSRTALGRGHIPAGAMPSMLVLAAGLSLVAGLWWIGRGIRSASPATTSGPP